MRTTIDLDEELLRTAKALAEIRHETLSKVISDLAWKGLAPSPAESQSRNGFPLLPKRKASAPVTMEHIRDLQDLLDREDAGQE